MPRTFSVHILAILVLLSARPSFAASFAQYFDLSILGDGYVQKSEKDFSNGQLHGRFKLLGNEEILIFTSSLVAAD